MGNGRSHPNGVCVVILHKEADWRSPWCISTLVTLVSQNRRRVYLPHSQLPSWRCTLRWCWPSRQWSHQNPHLWMKRRESVYSPAKTQQHTPRNSKMSSLGRGSYVINCALSCLFHGSRLRWRQSRKRPRVTSGFVLTSIWSLYDQISTPTSITRTPTGRYSW